MNRFDTMKLVMKILNICEECEVRKQGCKVPCAPVLKQFEDFELYQIKAGEQ